MEPLTDRLEQKWRELGEKIKAREAELEALKKQFKTLDDARVLLVDMTPANEAAATKLAVTQAKEQAPERGLQEAVLDYLEKSPADDGVSPGEIVNSIEDEFRSRYKSRNSFVASVFVSLARLAKQNRVKHLKTITGKPRYISNSHTRNLFGASANKEGAYQ